LRSSQNALRKEDGGKTEHDEDLEQAVDRGLVPLAGIAWIVVSGTRPSTIEIKSITATKLPPCQKQSAVFSLPFSVKEPSAKAPGARLVSARASFLSQPLKEIAPRCDRDATATRHKKLGATTSLTA